MRWRNGNCLVGNRNLSSLVHDIQWSWGISNRTNSVYSNSRNHNLLRESNNQRLRKSALRYCRKCFRSNGCPHGKLSDKLLCGRDSKSFDCKRNQFALVYNGKRWNRIRECSYSVYSECRQRYFLCITNNNHRRL